MAALPFLNVWSKSAAFDVDLAPFTSLKIGGKAAALVRPTDPAQLAAILQACKMAKVPVHFMGSGTNVLVKEQGWPGVVILFSEPQFQAITVSGDTIHAKTGAGLGALVSTAARHSLGGLETLAGLPGTVGGALKNDLKVKTGPLSQYVSSIELLDAQGKITNYRRDDVPIDQLLHAPDGAVILSADFELHPDQPEAIVKRLRKNWIQMRAHQPLSFERSARLFRDPPGSTANQLIVQIGAQTSSVGGATLSERDANYVVVRDPIRSSDVIELMRLISDQVEERLGQSLQPNLVVW